MSVPVLHCGLRVYARLCELAIYPYEGKGTQLQHPKRDSSSIERSYWREPWKVGSADRAVDAPSQSRMTGLAVVGENRDETKIVWSLRCAIGEFHYYINLDS
jgi:hypothetical protein